MQHRNSGTHFYSLRSEGVRYENLDIYYHYRTVKELILPGEGRCLDVGARDSNLKEFMLKNGYDYIGLDISLHPSLNIVGDGHRLPFKDKVFDKLILSSVLEHVMEPQSFMNEIYRVLKKEGQVYGVVSFLEPFHNSYFNMSYKAIEHLLTASRFENICIQTGVMCQVLILARIIGITGSKQLTLFSTLTKIMFPIKLVLKMVYILLKTKNLLLRKNMIDFENNFKDFYEGMALTFAGHFLFEATK